MSAHSMLITFLAVGLAVAAPAGSTQMGDITAAVRGVGLTTSVTVEPSGTVDGTAVKLVDGLTVDRYLTSTGTGPVAFTFSLPDGFAAGEDVVLTGVTFGVNTTWGNYALRMPRSWTVEGSNDGGVSWQTIVAVNGFTEYAAAGSLYSGTCSFANWRSFRTYRITVTEATGSATYFLQISEIALLGQYGGTVVKPDPVLIDITESVREVGKQSSQSNAGAEAPSLGVECVCNGIWGTSDRYLSSTATTKGLLDAGQTIDMDYGIDESFRRGADVVVTAYTIDVEQSFADAKSRLPKSWQLLGSNDGETWTLLDTVKGFCAWETKLIADEKTLVENPHYSYTFKFVNSASYRRYRLSVSELYDRVAGGNKLQVSEIQFHGYVDAGLVGCVGTAMDGMDFNMTVHETTGVYAPQVTASQYETGAGTDYGTVTNLFDGLFNTFLLARMGVDGEDLKFAPLKITYGMTDDYLKGKEIVLKRYTLVSRTNDIGQYQERMPKTWRLEGWIKDDWILLDRQTNFADWEIGEGNRYSKTFLLPNNRFSCRRYRLSICDTQATAATDGHQAMHQVLLYEIEMSGEWGVGISEPYVAKSTCVIFR